MSNQKVPTPTKKSKHHSRDGSVTDSRPPPKPPPVRACGICRNYTPIETKRGRCSLKFKGPPGVPESGSRWDIMHAEDWCDQFEAKKEED